MPGRLLLVDVSSRNFHHIRDYLWLRGLMREEWRDNYGGRDNGVLTKGWAFGLTVAQSKRISRQFILLKRGNLMLKNQSEFETVQAVKKHYILPKSFVINLRIIFVCKFEPKWRINERDAYRNHDTILHLHQNRHIRKNSSRLIIYIVVKSDIQQHK